jgi:hypothetical protein
VTARLGPWARDLTSARCGPCSARAFPTGPDAAAADADREENHDPEGDKEQVDEGGAIRERPLRCKGYLQRDEHRSGASMCSACSRSTAWLLALMNSADRIPNHVIALEALCSPGFVRSPV